MRPSRIHRCVVIALVAGSLSGCRYLRNGTLTDVRLDYNRYRACTLRFERRDHLPARTDHVRYMRWQHGAEPALPPCTEQSMLPPQSKRLGIER